MAVSKRNGIAIRRCVVFMDLEIERQDEFVETIP
jgi:hypothetical protein